MTNDGLMKKFFVSLLLLGWYISFLPSAGTAGDEEIEGLKKDLRSKNEKVQLSAVDKLVGLKDEGAIDALLDFVFITVENWRVKIRAINLLGEIPDLRVSDRLVTIFNNPFLNEECPAMKWHTALALGKNFNKGSRAVDSLIDALDNNNLLVREGIIQSLGHIGDSKAVPFLIPALSDGSFAIRFSAVMALSDIKDPRAVPYLRKIAYNDKDPLIKAAALSALKNFGTD